MFLGSARASLKILEEVRSGKHEDCQMGKQLGWLENDTDRHREIQTDGHDRDRGGDRHTDRLGP